MRRFLVLSLVIFSILACHSRSIPIVPANVIKPDSMVQVLTDVHILQASLQLGYTQSDTDITAQKAFEIIWKKHKISEDEYNRSMKFYSYQPALLDSIYEKVLNNLVQQKAELMGKKHP